MSSVYSWHSLLARFRSDGRNSLRIRKKLRLIDSPEGGLGEARLNAEDAYRSTRTGLYETKRFGWRLRGGSERSKVLRAAEKEEKEQWRALKALNKEREKAARRQKCIRYLERRRCARDQEKILGKI